MSRMSKAIRRKQISRRKIIFLAASTLVIVFVIGILCGTLFTKARSNGGDADDIVMYKYYTSIEIAEGDSLWKIASEYVSDEYTSIDEYVQEIIQLNALEDDIIHYGQYLTIPYYSDVFM